MKFRGGSVEAGKQSFQMRVVVARVVPKHAVGNEVGELCQPRCCTIDEERNFDDSREPPEPRAALAPRVDQRLQNPLILGLVSNDDS